MRNAISNQESSGTTRQQPNDQPCSYHETLGCLRHQYERRDIARPKICIVEAPPMAEVTWADAMTTADRLKHISDLALTMELNRRGYRAAGKILSGRCYPSGKKVHKKKSLKRGN